MKWKREIDSLIAMVKLDLYLKNAEKFFHICSFSLNKFINHVPVDKICQLRQAYSLKQIDETMLASVFMLYFRQ